MRLVRFGPTGQERPGMLDAAGAIRDLSSHVDDIAGQALRRRSLDRLAQLDPASLPLVTPGQRLGPCVGHVPDFIGVGLNYADHAAEADLPVPAEPILFGKATSSIIGPNDDVMIPRGSEKTDWEVELAIVIGETATYVDEANALDIVAGYCICNDISERTFQMDRGGTWSKGKGCPTFGPLGPWLVTRDEVPDPQNLSLWLEMDGVRRQQGTTAMMIFGVRYLVHYISQFMRLEPGDVITTGTPPGVGMGQKPPTYLKPGQVMRLGIEGLGEQTQRVVAWEPSVAR